MRLLLCLFIFSFLSLFAEEEFEPQEVATTEGLPSSIVGGSVCAITGEFTDASTDIVVAGAQPLVITRYYSNHYNEGSLGYGWLFNHYEKVCIDPANTANGPAAILSHRQPSGAIINFRAPEKDAEKGKADFQILIPKGLTNGASQLSGRTNIKNLRMKLNPENRKGVVNAIAGDGEEKEFEKFDHKDNVWGYYIKKTHEKSNGFLFAYDYTEGLLTKISCHNKKRKTIYSSLEFKDVSKRDYGRTTILTSDNRKFNYHYEIHSCDEKVKTADGQSYTREVPTSYLAKVESDYTATEEFTYGRKATDKHQQVVKKRGMAPF